MADEDQELARIHKLRRDGLIYLKIANALNEERRATKKGGPWRSMSVRSVLMSAEKITVD